MTVKDCLVELDDKEYDLVWNRFDTEFDFTPSVDKLPGINEPKGSVTLDVSGFYENTESDIVLLEKDLNEKVLNSFKAITKSGEFIYALDWQHTCYKVDISKLSINDYNKLVFNDNGLLYTRDGTNHYCFSIYPDGDYYILLTNDLKNGIFGHPWEQSICVFGDELLKALKKNMPRLFNKILRQK